MRHLGRVVEHLDAHGIAAAGEAELTAGGGVLGDVLDKLGDDGQRVIDGIGGGMPVSQCLPDPVT